MVTLSSEDFNQLVELISSSPAFMNPNGRFTWVYGFLQGSPRAAALMGSLNIGGGAPRLDAIALVQYLTRFGQDVPGREVITLLINGLLQGLGEGEDAEFLRSLLERYPLEAASAGSQPIKILFVSASPDNLARLRSDREYREVDAALQSSRYRDRFTLIAAPATRVLDLPELLLRHEPNVVHFSGHGAVVGLVAEQNDGSAALIPPEAAAALFRALSAPLRLVVLNACLSETQADAIAGEVGCVVGMTGEIGDGAAILFATGFYQALGYGQSVQKAFDLGTNRIALGGSKGSATPRLIARRGVSADDLVLAR